MLFDVFSEIFALSQSRPSFLDMQALGGHVTHVINLTLASSIYHLPDRNSVLFLSALVPTAAFLHVSSLSLSTHNIG